MHPQYPAFAQQVTWLCACSALSLFPCSVPLALSSGAARKAPRAPSGLRSMQMKRAGDLLRGALGGLRGGGGGGGLAGLKQGSWSAGKPPPEAWLKKEQIGHYSPYFQSAVKRHMDLGGKEEGDSEEAINTVQMMVDHIAHAFDPSRGGAPLSETELAEVACSVTAVTASDLGVTQGEPVGKVISYTEVYDGKDFTICIFRLPAGARLPMHDHPGMTVFSKVIYGELGVKAYDRIEPGGATSSSSSSSSSSVQSAVKRVFGAVPPPFKVKVVRGDEVWSAEDGAQVTGPESGNIHQFRAVTDCCVLDVLAPPYDFANGRRCTYYDIDAGPDGTHWARPIRCPDDYQTRSKAYAGQTFKR